RKFLAGAIVVIALGGGGLSYAQGNDSMQASSVNEIPAPLTGESTDADTSLALKRFSIFAVTAEIGATASATQRAQRSLGDNRLDPSLSRIAYKDDAFTLYVFANQRTICYAGFVSTEVGAMDCLKTQRQIDNFAAGEPVPTVMKVDDGYRMWAVLPDGTRDV